MLLGAAGAALGMSGVPLAMPVLYIMGLGAGFMVASKLGLGPTSTLLAVALSGSLAAAACAMPPALGAVVGGVTGLLGSIFVSQSPPVEYPNEAQTFASVPHR